MKKQLKMHEPNAVMSLHTVLRDTAQKELDRIDVNSVAQYTYSENRIDILYEVHDKDFGAPDLTQVTVLPKRGQVVVIRRGFANATFFIEQGVAHASEYQLPFGTMDFRVTGIAFDSALKEQGGVMRVSYLMEAGENGDIHELEMTVTPMDREKPKRGRKSRKQTNGVEHLKGMERGFAEAKQAILRAVGELTAEGSFPAADLPAFRVELPADRAHGDFAANAAMVFAKALKKNPRVIAQEICDKLYLGDTCFERAEIAGPGFINFYLSQAWYSEVVSQVIETGEEYGHVNIGNGQRVLVEFVSANPTGPMHVGNARGGAIGDTLASVLQAAGYETEREFYINDAGNQIEKFGKSLELRYMQLLTDAGQAQIKEASSLEELCNRIYGEDGNNPEFPMPEDVYRGRDIIAHAKNFYDIKGDSLKDASEADRRKALVEYALPLNIQGLKDDLGMYRIQYDTWFPESTLHADGSVQKIIEQLKASGYTYEQDGALWFKAEALGADKDFVLVRANGIPTYVVPDIAYHYNKLMVRKFDRAIDILGADHHGYVPRLKAALKALGADPDKLSVILMQMVAVMRDGKPVKQSKRSGKALTLVTLLEDIPVDAARFFFNLREANSHFEFDLDLAVEQSSSNPVYYVQYAHARICSLLRNLTEAGVNMPDEKQTDLSLLASVPERELIRQIAMLPMEIENAAKAFDPSRLTKYSVDLAAQFHKFYDGCKVRDAETPALRDARMLLCKAASQTLGNVLSVMKVTAPERM